MYDDNTRDTYTIDSIYLVLVPTMIRVLLLTSTDYSTMIHVVHRKMCTTCAFAEASSPFARGALNM